ncbi:hypothetical protein IMSAGC015_02301 [Lachnospiraceae bacterium]|nr:hypothetical protein IMSAGC015_02301 [Lachnospiraceae bacterium]
MDVGGVIFGKEGIDVQLFLLIFCQTDSSSLSVFGKSDINFPDQIFVSSRISQGSTMCSEQVKLFTHIHLQGEQGLLVIIYDFLLCFFIFSGEPVVESFSVILKQFKVFLILLHSVGVFGIKFCIIL